MHSGQCPHQYEACLRRPPTTRMGCRLSKTATFKPIQEQWTSLQFHRHQIRLLLKIGRSSSLLTRPCITRHTIESNITLRSKGIKTSVMLHDLAQIWQDILLHDLAQKAVQQSSQEICWSCRIMVGEAAARHAKHLHKTCTGRNCRGHLQPRWMLPKLLWLLPLRNMRSIISLADLFLIIEGQAARKSTKLTDQISNQFERLSTEHQVIHS